MKALLVLLWLAIRASADWQSAMPGWQYEFPRDHGAHPDFKTEWWYLTGNMRDNHGREFGFQLTFFRHGINQTVTPEQSHFMVRDLKFTHFAISDLGARQFFFRQRTSRGAFGEAGSGLAGRLAWIDDWQFMAVSDGSFEIEAKDGENALRLHLETEKPPVIHGENGVSQKASGEGHASQYYSFTRMAATGELTVRGAARPVTGETWFDHEWATNQLTAEQAGWNWFSLQLTDGRDLMLYQMRRRDGGIDPNSSGTIVERDGTSRHLRSEDFKLTPLGWWKNAQSGARYPVRWRLEIPWLDLAGEITSLLENQELALPGIAYWEGAIRFDSSSVRGRGYMELTGYQHALTGLRAPR